MKAYADGIRGIFIMFVPLGALSLILSLFVLDVGLPDDKPKEGPDCETTDDAGDVGEPPTTEHRPGSASVDEKVASTGSENSKTGTDKIP